MVDPRYITITVRYDREPKSGRSLERIAPELKGAALRMTEDHLGDPTPSRTWAGLVDGPTYEQLVNAWRLPTDADEAGDDRDPVTHTYTLDGMNWEAGSVSPIVCVSLQVCSRPHRTETRPPGSTRRNRPCRR
jgi:hypothetical protein